MKIFSATIFLAFVMFFTSFGQTTTATDTCKNDVPDQRGIMKPWEKGAYETGKYRNVFLEAGYKQADIDAKLAKAYYDVFEGPKRVYF